MKQFVSVKSAVLLLLALIVSLPVSAEDESPAALSPFFETEAGFVKVLTHVFQSGDPGTKFNFITQGGQEILFPFSRYRLGFTLNRRHLFTALYQPLTINTAVTFREDVTIDGVTFSEGTPMELTYGFPFWRFSYGFDLLPADNLDLYTGAALQFRNASIRFAARDGSDATTNQNLGLVPSLYAHFGYTLGSGLRVEAEATGIYASSAIINGADFQFTGSLLDTSLRILAPVKTGVHSFLNIRFLGGTSEGISQFEDRFWTQAVGNYGLNNLGTMSFTAGLRIQ